jgi:hypothetical protein
MALVEKRKPAPLFSAKTYPTRELTLKDFQGKKKVLPENQKLLTLLKIL